MEKIFIGWNWAKFSAGIKKLTFRSSSYSAFFDMLWNRDHWPKSVQTWRNWKISFLSEKLGIFTYFDQSKSFYSYFWYPKLVREEKKNLEFLAVFSIFWKFFHNNMPQKTPQDWFLGYFLPPNQILRGLVTLMLHLVLKWWLFSYTLS